MTDPMPIIVVAASKNHVIGSGGQLPWKLRSDLQRFKALTMGHWLIMGRKTWDSIGRALPGRETVVVSRQPDLQIPQVHVASSVEQAIHMVPSDKIPFVVGGAEIYRQAMPLCKHLYLTRVECESDGDAYFDSFDPNAWRLVRYERIPSGPHDQYETEFQEWIRS